MSYDLQDAAWAAPIKPVAAKIILVYLAHKTNSKSGACFPSIKTISEYTGLDRKTVMKSLERLESMGMITSKKKIGCCTHYQVSREKLGEYADVTSTKIGTATSTKSGTGTENGSTKNGTAPVPKTVQDQYQKRDTNKEVTSKEQGREKRPHPMPEGWQPKESTRQTLKSHGWSDSEIDLHIYNLRNWTLAQNKKYVDWDAALRNQASKNYEKVKQSRPADGRIAGVYAS